MLTRAARQHIRCRIRQQAFIAEYNQLALPFLYPAVPASIRQSRRATNFTSTKTYPRHRSPSPGSRSSGAQQARQLATATDSYQPGSHGDPIPFEGLSLPSEGKSSWSSHRPAQHTPAALSKFNTSQIILVPEQPRQPANAKRTHAAITGNLIDLQQNLYACVQIGRLDRAAALTRHITRTLGPAPPQVYDAHLRYFSGLLESLLQSPDETVLTRMQKWLELDIRENNIPIDSRILVLIIKATIVTLDGSRLDRTLRRYLGYAQDLGLRELDETVSADIFTDAEWKMLLRQCPEDYKPPQDLMDEVEHDDQAEDAEQSPKSTEMADGLQITETQLDLRPVALKGLGLEALRQSMKSLNAPETGIADLDSADEQVTRQIELEQQVLDAALKRWHEESMTTQEMRARGQLSNPKLGSHVHDWVQSMSKLLRQKVAETEALETKSGEQHKESVSFAPLMKMLDPEKACAATILTYLETLLQSGNLVDRNTRAPGVDTAVQHTSVRMLVLHIGNEVVREAKAEEVEHHYLQKLSSMTSTKRREQLAKLVKRRRPFEEHENGLQKTNQGHDDAEKPKWTISTTLRHKLGAEMLSMMIKVAELPEQIRDKETGKVTSVMRPVVEHSTEWVQGKKRGVVKTSAELVSRLKVEPVSSFIAKHLPMLCPPKPWTGLQKGGYLKNQAKFVRLKDSSVASEAYWQVADKRGDLSQSYAAVDVISKVPWRVHEDLLKVMTEVWNTGEEMAKFAPENPSPELPPEPQPSDRVAHRKWKNDVRQLENEAIGHHSQRCYQNFQLEVARSYVGKDFYTPHSIDFRGRAYPIPPYFNHIGADYVRALFTFAEGKALGEEGLYWLKIHTANVFGYDKESLADRQAFVDDHILQIYDSAVRPMKGHRWWLKAEDPWQCLAACMELKNALDSPVPSEFVSHLPVQQDGSCNGLQHYAALGGDEVGARQVNLSPGDRPADIYSAVASLVKDAIAADAAKGSVMAKVLDGKLTRKCVKQPVMTNVYGVTFRGAGLQVRKQLEDILPRSFLNENNVTLDQLSSYVARLIFQALSQMFNGAQAIQQWLGECGSRITQAVTPEQIERLKDSRYAKGKVKLRSKTKSSKLSRPKEDYQFKSTIIWTTPLGLPIVQPYREPAQQRIETTLQAISVHSSSLSDPVSKRQQLQAFPPNFIHSLDATHMFLSALKCDEAGICFASVHDSFWTHASSVPDMNRVLRDAFVRMHSENIVDRLREEFVARYSGCFYRASVTSNSEVGRKIRNIIKSSTRKVSHHARASIMHEAQIDDLLNEEERVRLLQSEDEAEREKGRAMVTPASIFEAEGGEDGATVPEDVAMLGQTPEGAEDLAKEAMAEVQDGVENEGAATASNEESGSPSTADGEQQKQRKSTRPTYIFFWRPLVFPPAPKRGTFDVTQLKDSKYFFS